MHPFCRVACGIVTLVSLNVFVVAQQPPSASTYPPVSLSSTHVRSMRSSIFSRDYAIYVSLPRSYDSTLKRYPVLYVTDADSGFGLAHVAVQQEQSDQEIPETIVVGIAYGLDIVKDFSAWSNRRTQELTPTSVKEYPGSGEAARFSRFIREELIPFIDANYRTDPTDRTLVGGSFGGLFAMYVMFQTPDAFQQYVARSPSLFWDDRMMFALERDYAATHHSLPVTLFTSVGSSETDRLLAAWRDFSRLLEDRRYAGFRMVKTTVPDAQHNAAIGTALYAAVKAVLGGMVLEDEVLERYIGRYTTAEGMILAITRDGRQLWAEWNDQPRLKLLARSTARFSFAAGQGDTQPAAQGLERLEFQVSDRGRIDSVEVHQNGRSMAASRTK